MTKEETSRLADFLNGTARTVTEGLVILAIRANPREAEEELHEAGLDWCLECGCWDGDVVNGCCPANLRWWGYAHDAVVHEIPVLEG